MTLSQLLAGMLCCALAVQITGAQDDEGLQPDVTLPVPQVTQAAGATTPAAEKPNEQDAAKPGEDEAALLKNSAENNPLAGEMTPELDQAVQKGFEYLKSQ